MTEGLAEKYGRQKTTLLLNFKMLFFNVGGLKGIFTSAKRGNNSTEVQQIILNFDCNN